MIGIRHRRIDPDHIGFQRQGGIDTGGTRMTRHATANPSDAAFAGKRDRRFRSASNHKMAHAVVTVDERSRRRAALHGDVGTGICRTKLQPLYILWQTENAVRIGTNQIRLKHQLRDPGCVILRHAHLGHRIDDQASDGFGWNAYALGRMDVHAFPNRA